MDADGDVMSIGSEFEWVRPEIERKKGLAVPK